MTPPITTGLSDMSVVLNGVEQLALVLVVVLVTSIVLRRKELIPSKYKDWLFLLVGFWAVAVILQYGISTYNYLHVIRPLQKETQSQSQGL